MIRSLLRNHAQALFYSLGLILRRPWASLQSIVVLAIAITMPAGLYLVTDSVNQSSSSITYAPQLSLILDKEISPQRVTALQRALEAHPEVQGSKYIDAVTGLTEFIQKSGIRLEQGLLTHNPIPPILVIELSPAVSDQNQQLAMAQQLHKLKGIVDVQIDFKWLRKIQSAVDLLSKISILLTILFAIGVTMIISNTIRLAMLSQQKEIEIKYLLGASKGFIRRPFLYNGILLGIAGALMAEIFLFLSYLYLLGPLTKFTEIFSGVFKLTTITLPEVGLLLLIGALLGWLASLIAVNKHLSQVR